MSLKIKNIYYVLFVIILSFNILNAKTKSIDTLAESSFYFMSILQQTNHNGGFNNFEDCKSCMSFDNVNYKDASNEDFGFGIGWEKRFASNFTIQNRFTFVNYNVNFLTNPSFLSYTPENTKLYSQHNLNVNFNTVGYHVIPSWNTDWGLTFGLGLNAVININPSFEYYEQLIDESNNYSFNTAGSNFRKLYPIGTKFRNHNEVLYSISPTLTFRNKISKDFELETEFSYNLALNNFLKDAGVDWKYNSLTFGLKFHWITKYQVYDERNLEPCEIGYIRDNEGNCIKECPEGFIYDTKSKECKPVKDCPDGFKNNLEGNCVPICPIGFIYDIKTQNCLKIKECPDGFVLNNNNICVKVCEEGYYFNFKSNNCEIEIPKSNQNCNGTYLGIQFNEIKNAENFQNYLKNELNINSFEIIQIQDVVDPKVIMFELQSGCFIDTQNAIESQRAIYDKLYPKSNFNEIEIILQTRK